MITTSDTLVNYVNDDGGQEVSQLSFAVIIDYYGVENVVSSETCSLINSIYSNLILSRGVTSQLLNKCFLSSRLDELIHKKYTYDKTEDYDEFVELGIKIGPTILRSREGEPDRWLGEVDPSFEINDDDHCPNCNLVGYFTENNCDYVTEEITVLRQNCRMCMLYCCNKCSKYYKNTSSIACNHCRIMEKSSD